MLELWAHVVQTISVVLTFVLGHDSDFRTPSTCFKVSRDIGYLAACLDTFTVPRGYYNTITYDMAQPIGTQREDWKTSINTLLSVDGNCSLASVPVSLHGLYDIAPFQDFCVLFETSSRCGTYLKGWGFMIVPSRRRAVARDVHISAPHPHFDGGTVEQAASVFYSTRSSSLLVAGRARNAFMSPSSCIKSGSMTGAYYRTDPAHNNEEPFFDASIAIHEWQHRRSGCPSRSCGFLQFHGKGTLTCASDHVFLSTGLGNSSSSQSWYTDNVDRPVKRLQRNLRHSFPSWTVSLPSDSQCPLTATKNVFGRHLNGIGVPHVCSKAATSRLATGEFIHAEQAPISRNPSHYEAWSKAVVDTFEATCSEGMVLDAETKLCIPHVGSDLENDQHAGYTMQGLHPDRSRWYTVLFSFLLM
ncbi:hypothetical protein D9613_002302 [Agrocybe pediades]|uniref:Uncharacterized protein n=1 Tax=Agrocybe pediades TaxID=84607 RepID=A0A8H4VWX0_9AGAR|nr:hypothetical protein D9613_002302 [Agrocybe pediades]